MKQVAPGRISQPGRLRTECDTPKGFWKRVVDDEENVAADGEH